MDEIDARPQPVFDQRTVRHCVTISRSAAAIVIGIGLVGFLGWVFDSELLKELSYQGVTIKANAALALILAGMGLALLGTFSHHRAARIIGRAVAIGAGLIGSLTLSQHLFGIDWGIDQLLFREPPGALATMSPGRMGPPASLSLTLAAIALLLLDTRFSRRNILPQGLALVIALISLLPLLGYAYGVQHLYGISKYTGIAVHTAFALLCIAVGLLLVRPREGFISLLCSEGPGGMMARRLVLPAIVIPFLLGWARTLGERHRLIDSSLGRPAVILSMSVIFVALTWWNARTIGTVSLARRRAEAERERALESLMQAKDEAERARAAAEAANEAKDRFLAVLSHELRTPLSPVLAAAQLMEMDPDVTGPVRESAAMIRRNVELEARLIDDLLDLTRITRGKLELRFEPVDLHASLRAVVDMLQQDIRGGRLSITTQLAAARSRTRADATRMQQVFWNLLKNAVKFTPAGGTISICSASDDTTFTLSVQDSGIGIEPQVLPRLFAAFEQADRSVTRLFGGLGLGLAISKSVVEAHGGTIRAQSDGPGRGSCFTVRIPLVGEPGVDVPSPPPADVPAPASSAGRCRILLVEDHPDTAAAMKRLLGSIGYEVRVANSVSSAIDAAQPGSFDILISDIGLPDGTGHDVMRQLLTQSGVKGIALSGFGMEEDIQKSRRAGFLHHLTKPVNPTLLASTLQQLSSGDAKA